MRDLKRFTEELEPAAEALDPSDSRLAQLADLMSSSEYTRAADLATELFDEGHWDIRAITATMMAHYLEEGPSAIAEVCATLEVVVSQNMGAIEPARRRETFVDRQIDWLFSTLRAYSEYQEKKETSVFKGWEAKLQIAELDQSVEATLHLSSTLPGSFEKALNGLARYQEWLRNQKPVLLRRDAQTAEKKEEEAPVNEGDAGQGQSTPEHDTIEVSVSPALAALLAKLDAFEKLVSKQRYRKAALVSADLRRLLNEFDPREYFPEIFAQYSSELSKHVGDIAPFWDRLEEIEFQVLHEFYRVDLDRFVEDE